MPSVRPQPLARHLLVLGPAQRQGRGVGPPSSGGPPPWTGTSRGEVRLRNVLADDWRPDMAPAAGRTWLVDGRPASWASAAAPTSNGR